MFAYCKLLKTLTIVWLCLPPPATTTEETILFKRLGKTIPTASFVHVALTIEITPLLDRLNALEKAISRVEANLGETLTPDDMAIMADQHYLLRDMKESVEMFLSMKEPFGQEIDVSRNKRFIFSLLALGTLAATTAFGIFNRVDLTSIQRDLSRQSKRLSNVVTIQNKMLKTLTKNDEELVRLDQAVTRIMGQLAATTAVADANQRHAAVNAALGLAQREVNTLSEVIQDMQVHRLSPRLLRKKTLAVITNEVAAKTRELGYVPLLKYKADLLECQTSYVSTETGFTLLVHVPVALPDTELDVLQLLSVPMRLDGEHFIRIDNPLSVIALREDPNGDRKEFKTFTTEDLQNCHKQGTWLICKDSNVMQVYNPSKNTSDPHTCLYALVHQHYEVVQRTCEFHIVREEDSVLQFADRTFFTYSSEPHQGTIHCPDDQDGKATRFTAHGASRMELGPGCVARTDTHVFAAGLHLSTAPWTMRWKWPQTPALNLSSGLDLPAFDRFVKHHRAHGFQVPTELAEIKKHLNAFKQTEKDILTPTARSPLSLAALIIAIVIIGGIMVGICTYIRRNYLPTEDEQPAPAPAPATTIHINNHTETTHEPARPHVYPTAPSFAMS